MSVMYNVIAGTAHFTHFKLEGTYEEFLVDKDKGNGSCLRISLILSYQINCLTLKFKNWHKKFECLFSGIKYYKVNQRMCSSVVLITHISLPAFSKLALLSLILFFVYLFQHKQALSGININKIQLKLWLVHTLDYFVVLPRWLCKLTHAAC
jgi:hypothetical protein